jgi:predicted CXXCH cytochrome family protein
MKRIVIVLMLILCTALLIAEVKKPAEKAAEVKAPEAAIKIEQLSKWFEGVTFDHKLHSGMACADCHHAGFDNGASCGGCHSAEVTSPNDIGLKIAYHKVCSNCHLEKGKEVKQGCENCHKRKALPEPKK